MTLKILIAGVVVSASLSAVAQKPTENVKVKTGTFEPTWESAAQWECPEWFKDAKFGIWAHWGPQCQAEAGDWYAHFMYLPGSGQYDYHLSHYGDPSVYGLKELCRDWKAENWDPAYLVSRYKSVGARYFMTLGQHHDNFDLWDSPYQEWNSVNIGPKRDIVGEWAKACKDNGMPLGVSMHGSHTWTWMEGSKEYDGKLTKADGVGQWWEGYDPQELYAQNHPHSNDWPDLGALFAQWAWENGAALPDAEFKQKFQNRVLQCINDYQPDVIYFDDTVLPFYGCDESIGLNILAHYYNTNPSVVVTGKVLEPLHKRAMMLDVERGVSDKALDDYWQTCTCIGEWHYNRAVYDNNSYKSAQQVIDMLIDIVSKNGNLLLSVPVRADGTIDEKEEAVLDGIKAWMDQNSRSIYGTRCWKTFGEGPMADASKSLETRGFNEANDYSEKDVRYVVKYAKNDQQSDTLFATIMRWPSARKFTFESLGRASQHFSGEVESVELLGYGLVDSSLGMDGLTVELPVTPCNDIAPVFAVTFKPSTEKSVTLSEVADYYEQFLASLDCSYNTGFPNRNAVNDFSLALNDARSFLTADFESQQKALGELRQAWGVLQHNVINQPGDHCSEAYTDLTLNQLIESSDFTRTTETNGLQRFGAPEYWTVDNFKIPNGNDGVKEGLDAYTGKSSLMLGVWNDRQNAPSDCDLKNARIYRKMHLTPCRYYFGAIFNSSYNLPYDAYMFASPSISSTNEIPSAAIAFAHLSKAPMDANGYWGITFEIETEQDIYIGFAADLTGNDTQEFRAHEVAFLRYDLQAP